jgi:hypothetical protein
VRRDQAPEGTRAAWERGAASARADCAAAIAPTVIDVSLDAGNGRRTHIGWCLLCQVPASRCGCDNTIAIEALVEDPVEVLADVAGLIAESREQLHLHAQLASGIVDVAITGDRL